MALVSYDAHFFDRSFDARTTIGIQMLNLGLPREGLEDQFDLSSLLGADWLCVDVARGTIVHYQTAFRTPPPAA